MKRTTAAAMQAAEAPEQDYWTAMSTSLFLLLSSNKTRDYCAVLKVKLSKLRLLRAIQRFDDVWWK